MSEPARSYPIAPVVLLSLVSNQVTLAVPQALIDDTPAFAYYIETLSDLYS